MPPLDTKSGGVNAPLPFISSYALHAASSLLSFNFVVKIWEIPRGIF